MTIKKVVSIGDTIYLNLPKDWIKKGDFVDVEIVNENEIKIKKVKMIIES